MTLGIVGIYEMQKRGLKYDIYTSSRIVHNMDNNAVNAPRFFAFGIKKWAAYFIKAALA
jgi:hypothetical protein